MEGGELFDRIVNQGRFDEPVAKFYFYQMLQAIKVAEVSHSFKYLAHDDFIDSTYMTKG